MRIYVLMLAVLIAVGALSFVLYASLAVAGRASAPMLVSLETPVDAPAVMPSIVAVTPELILLFTALAIMLFDFVVPNQRARFPLLGAAGALIALCYAVSGIGAAPVAAFAEAIVTDEWTSVARVVAIASAAAMLFISSPENFLASVAPRERKGLREGEITVLVLLSAVGVCFLAASRDMLVTMVSFEIMSLSLYPLLALNNSRRSNESALKYFIMGAFATAVMLYGVSFIFGETGTTRYFALRGFNPRILLGFTLFSIGFLVKLGVVPFHAWLPDAYETAPSMLGGWMSAGVKAGAVAAIGRIVFHGINAPPSLTTIFVAMTVATLFMGNAGALFQTNLARLLGYSAIGHAGFMMMGAVASLQTRQADGVTSLLFYLVSYAPAALGAFVVVGMTEEVSAERLGPSQSGGRRIESLRGLFYRKPAVAVCMAVFMASLAGLPPLFGFWGKFQVFLASYQSGRIGLVAVALLNSLIGAWYYVKVIRESFTPPERYEQERSSPASLVVIVLAALLVIWCGLMPGAVWNFCAEAALGMRP